MAEDEFVSKDQHRADLFALRGELKEDISGIRQDVALLAKNVEHLAQTMQTGFVDMRREMTNLKADMSHQMADVRREMADLKADMGRQMTELKSETAHQIADLKADMAHQMTDLKADTGHQIAEIRQSNSDLRQDLRGLHTTVQRQMWALIALAAGTITKVLFFP